MDGAHWRIQTPFLGVGVGSSLVRGPNLGYPENWKLHGFNPLILGLTQIHFPKEK